MELLFIFQPTSSVGGTASGSAATSVFSAEEELLRTHPFYRFPVVPEHMSVEKIKWTRESASLVCARSLKAIRALFKKDTLVQADVTTLSFETARLLSYGNCHMDKNLSGMHPVRAAEAAAVMLVVVDTLYAAGHSLGSRSGFQTWWPAFMQTIPKNVVPRKQAKISQEVLHNLKLTEDLLGAVEVYRTGARPPAKILVPLKQRIFCLTPVIRFQYKGWNPWREDDKAWQEHN